MDDPQGNLYRVSLWDCAGFSKVNKLFIYFSILAGIKRARCRQNGVISVHNQAATGSYFG